MQTTAKPCPIVKQTPAEADERQLAARVARGEPLALEELIERYGQRVTALALRLLAWSDGADDVTQDVFLQVLKKGKHFRGEASLWTWLATLTVNRCRSLQRRQWMQDRVLRAIATLRSQPEHEIAVTEQNESAARVRQAVAELPASYREVIVLRYFEELPIDEMTGILGAKRNAIEARLSRARKQLEEKLKQLH